MASRQLMVVVLRHNMIRVGATVKRSCGKMAVTMRV